MTEYKKNGKGVWLPIDIDANKNHNEINWKKFKVNILNKLKFLSELLPLLTVFSTVIGALSIYSYLKIINYDFLFSNIIGEPSSLIAIVIVNFLFFLLLSIGFLSPFVLNFFINNEYNILINYKIILLKIFQIISISFIIFNCVFFVISVFYNIDYGHILYFLCFLFVVISLRASFYLYNYLEIKSVDLLLFPLITIMPYCLFFLITIIPSVKTIQSSENITWAFFIFGHIIIIINSIMAMNYFKSKNRIMIIMACFTLSLFFYFYLILFQKYELSLRKAKFIEKPQDSSWYLIHNGNTTSKNINGFDENQISILKKDFSPMHQCVGIDDNILFGYFAWNLGNTKVFCPVSVDFFNFTDSENERLNQAKNIDKEKSKILAEKSAKCLVIDGKYLQLISNHYLSQK